MLIGSGPCERALVVGAEASVHPLFLGSFQRLGVLPPAGFGCRPFDEERAGFLMSDAAAAVCLERDGADNVMAYMDGYAMGADATHITGSDPSGALLRQLLGRVIASRPIDLVHAHGTGTVANDAIELDAIESVVTQPSQPLLYSHKAALGHSLGAAGMVSVVLNCLAMRHGLVPGNVRLDHSLPVRRVLLNREPVVRPIRRSIAMAAGFGGPMAVVSLALNHESPSQRSGSWDS
jgi:3-oxoacyl-[acyl-carrier-protein] synthase II